VAYSDPSGHPLPRPGSACDAAGGAIDERGFNVRLLPWEYLFTRFDTHLFPDLYTVTWVATLVLLVALVILYNVRTRALHRHAPYLDMYEWLLWSGISLFGLILVAAVFNFYLIVLLVILVSGLAVLAWVRFVRFPPIFEVYEQKLAKQRYFTRSKFAHPESTIRPRAAKAAAAKTSPQRSRAGRNRKRR
jgi:hypothetical protein